MFDVTQNPFVYGEVVPAAAFVDRVAELERLVRDLDAGQKVFLISPRRYGKSSLIRRFVSGTFDRDTLYALISLARVALSDCDLFHPQTNTEGHPHQAR